MDVIKKCLNFLLASLESPTSPRQALLGCCMPQRAAGEGSGARQKPKTSQVAVEC